MPFVFKFEEIDGKLCYDDKVHYSFLWPMYENNILKNCMKFNVKLDITNDWVLDHGPNHNGLLVVAMSKADTNLLTKVKKMFGEYETKVC